MFFGFEPLIETQLELSTPNQSHYLSLLPLLLLFGLIVGISILFYINFLRTFTLRLRHSFKEKEILWVLPMLGGLGYGIFLLIFIPFIPKSTQVDILQPDVLLLNFLTGNIQNETLILLLILLLFIVIAIFLSISIGTLNSAGIIMPLMIFGAIMGGLFGLIFYPQQPLLFVLLGISAVLGAATNNPIAAIFIIVEMTWMPLLFIPAGITTIIAYIFSGPNSIIPHQRDIKSIKEKFMITI